jgi:hypothetical protein
MVTFGGNLEVAPSARLVAGRACHEFPDRDNEIFDFEGSWKHFVTWALFANALDPTSYGAVWVEHKRANVGKLKYIAINTAERAVDVIAQIDCDDAWLRIECGYYSGFSLGGSYTRRWPVVEDGKALSRYVARPGELSIGWQQKVPGCEFKFLYSGGAWKRPPRFDKDTPCSVCNYVPEPRFTAKEGKHDTDFRPHLQG